MAISRSISKFTTGRSKYKGMTNRELKKINGKAHSDPGIEKGETCRATGLDKAMAKYPRSYKIYPVEYIAFNKKKDKASQRQNTFFS